MTRARFDGALRLGAHLALFWTIIPLAVLMTPLWAWPIPSLPTLTLVVCTFGLCLWAGGIAGWAFARSSPALPAAPSDTMQVSALLHAVLALTVVMNAATLVFRAGFNPLTCGDLLACATEAYNAYIENSLAGEGAAFEYVRILLGPVLGAGVAASVWLLVFRQPGVSRVLPICVVASEIAMAIGTGTSRALANIIIFALLLLYLRKRTGLGGARRPVSAGTYATSALAVVLFFVYFAFTQLNRDGLVAAVGLLPFNGGFIESWTFLNDSDNFLIKGFESVARYLCSGYFSLSLGLGMQHGLTFPLGNSMVLARRAALGGDETYVAISVPGQIESAYDWSYLQQWHSIFSWLLSDFGYAGVGVIMFALGFLFVLSLAMALTRSDWFSKLPFYTFFAAILYIPANNQLMQGFEAITSTLASVVLLTAWAAWKWRPRVALA